MILVDGGDGYLSTADPSLDPDDFRNVGIRRGLVPGLMGPMPVEVVFVGREDLAGVGLAEQQDVIGAVVPRSPDPPLCPAIRPELAWRSAPADNVVRAGQTLRLPITSSRQVRLHVGTRG